MLRLLLCMAMLAPSLALASPAEMRAHPFDDPDVAGQYLTGVAMNASPSARTVTLPTKRKYSKLLFTLDFTRDSCTDLPIDFTCAGDSAGGTHGTGTFRTCSDGVCDFIPRGEWACRTGNTCATFVRTYEWDIQGCEEVAIVVGGSGGGTACGASDLASTVSVGLVGG